jgi:hypothetical protein
MSWRPQVCGLFLLLVSATIGAPAYAQADLSGEWRFIYHEDQPERIPGPELADYMGLPLSDGARQWALSWDASRLTLPEHQCQVHIAPYIYRGPGQVRIWLEKDEMTQRVVAVKNYIATFAQTRTIWMDGRPHPPEYAPHTWEGFSTGKWEGDMLTVTTTHIKQGWIRRNGVPESDRVTLTEHFIRHGDTMTHVTVIEDPDYLTEPLVKSQNFLRNERINQGNWTWPCEPVDEVANRPRGEVQHYLIGQNPFIKELVEKTNFPVEVLMGGAQTMYPEYQLKLAELKRNERSTAPAR